MQKRKYKKTSSTWDKSWDRRASDSVRYKRFIKKWSAIISGVKRGKIEGFSFYMKRCEGIVESLLKENKYRESKNKGDLK